MAGRDLRAFFYYRIRKRLLGLGRYGLRSDSQQYHETGGAFMENPVWGSEQYDTVYSRESIKRPLEKEQQGLQEAGAAGGKKNDFLPENLDLQAAAEAGRLIKKLVTSISRRRKQGNKHKIIDMRNTIHRNMNYGGTLLNMHWQMRKPAKPRVVLILDTSSSMIPSATMMLQFLYALQKEVRRTEVFIFGNELNYVTPYLRGDFNITLQEISCLPQWNYGGTEIWRPLARLRKNYAHLLTSRTTVILVTDCQFYEKFFALEPLDKLRRRVKRLYIFNPSLQARNFEEKYYQETLASFKTVVDRMFYTETIHEVARALRQVIN